MTKMAKVAEAVKMVEPASDAVQQAVARLTEAGSRMTTEERLEQRRYFLYGTKDPDPKTRERVDEFMKREYGV